MQIHAMRSSEARSHLDGDLGNDGSSAGPGLAATGGQNALPYNIIHVDAEHLHRVTVAVALLGRKTVGRSC